MVMLACLAAVLGVALLAVPATRQKLAALRTRTEAAVSSITGATADTPQIALQAAPPLPTLKAPVNVADVKTPAGTTFFAWAFLDRRTNTMTGSANSATGTNSTESMVKAWIASDYLRTQAASGITPSDATLGELTLMIIDSNDNMAEKYYEADGTNAVMQRMIQMCGLTHTTIFPYWWAKTQMSPQDAVRYGLCVANGTAAGPKWTDWILNTMRNVRGGVADQISVTKQGGRWGIIDALPPTLAADTSIKNGWTSYGDGWHVNCMAITTDWVLNVMVRTGRGLQTAANDCKSVAATLLVTPDI
jgi:hypothetical protein